MNLFFIPLHTKENKTFDWLTTTRLANWWMFYSGELCNASRQIIECSNFHGWLIQINESACNQIYMLFH